MDIATIGVVLFFILLPIPFLCQAIRLTIKHNKKWRHLKGRERADDGEV